MMIHLASQLPEKQTQMEQILTVTVHAIEAVGAILIVASVVIALAEIAWAVVKSRINDSVRSARIRLAQRMVLALEFLIAADILKTIITPNLEGMALLGAIIAIRTVLSLSIAYELKRPQLQPDTDTPAK